jgi:hypothetical protein
MFLRANEGKKLIAVIDYLGQSYNIVFSHLLTFISVYFSLLMQYYGKKITHTVRKRRLR